LAGYVQIRGEELIYDEAVEALSDAAYRLYMNSFFSQQRSMIGLIRWTPSDMIPRAQGWDREGAQKALEEVVGAGLVAYDPDARLLFNPRVAEHHPIRGYKQAKGAATLLAELPDSPLLVPVISQVLPELETAPKGKSGKESERAAETVEALKARLERLTTPGPDTPMEGVSEESAAEDSGEQKPDTPMEGVSIGVSIESLIPVSIPLSIGVSKGVSEGVSIGASRGHEEATPTDGMPDDGGPICGLPLNSPDGGIDGGIDTLSMGVSGGYPSRGRARAGASKSNPNPKSKETPQTPLAPDDGGSGQGDGSTESKPKRQGRKSPYAGLG
jgi:hypothetical protein